MFQKDCFSYKYLSVILWFCFFCMGSGKNSLIESIMKKEKVIFEQLLQGNRDKLKEERLDDGATALHIAVRISDSDDGYWFLQRLLQEGFCPSTGNVLLEPPLHEVVFIQNLERRKDVIEGLLFFGARLLQEDIKGECILEKLIALRSIVGLEHFLESYGYLVNEEVYDRGIVFAGQKAGSGLGLTDLAEILVKNKKIKRGAKTIFEGVIESDEKLIRKLIIKDQSSKDRKDQRWSLSPLMVAALRGERGVMGLLIKEKVNVNTQDAQGCTVLHYLAKACMPKDIKKELIRLLIFHGADEKIFDAQGKSALKWIEEAGITQDEVIKKKS